MYAINDTNVSTHLLLSSNNQPLIHRPLVHPKALDQGPNLIKSNQSTISTKVQNLRGQFIVLHLHNSDLIEQAKKNSACKRSRQKKEKTF